MDIRRFFDSVDHSILKQLLRNPIKDENVLKITDMIIDSFKIDVGSGGNIGIPLGNVTSQLFANVYLHELDHFVKQELKEKYYLRYCDDWAPRRNVNNISGFIEDEGRSLEVDLQGLASNRLVTDDSQWGLRESNKEKAA
jgi:retron-type reverse transcriptase